MRRPPPRSTLFPYTTLFRSLGFTTNRAKKRKRAMNWPPCYALSLPISGAGWFCTTRWSRSEEHTSELQSHSDLVCRLLLEKKKKTLLTTPTRRRRTRARYDD